MQTLKSENLVRYNTRCKVYPDGTFNLMHASRAIFRDPYDELFEPETMLFEHMLVFECWLDGRRFTLPEIEPAKPQSESRERTDSMKRSKDKVFDIAYCNAQKLTYFLTITFDPQQVDSLDPREVMQKVRVWLNNMQKRRGLSYLLIPECHKSGRIHCHALVNDVFKLTDSGKRYHGKTVYNVDDWKYGFSTAIPIDGEAAQLAHYVTKYLTKGNNKIFGKYYWSSRDLVRQPQILLSNEDYITAEGAEVIISGANVRYKYNSSVGWQSVDDADEGNPLLQD